MLYEVVLFGELFSQETVNRWNYVSSGTPATVSGSFALMSAMGFIPNGLGNIPADTVMAYLLAQVSSAWSANNVLVRAAADYAPADFYELPYTTPFAGSQAGNCNSPALSFGFRTNRVRLDIGRGTKRFAGVVEADSDNGGVITSARLAGLDALADVMSDVLEYDDEGNVLSFAPVVVQKEKYTAPSGKPAYKYYDTLTEQMDHVASSILWQPYTTVRTQVSRQYGRGV